MGALVDQKVTSEMLAREAIALGLDEDDGIIRRRLAQKTDFLIADVAALAPPGDEELQAWFGSNRSEFSLPTRLSFHHLHFSFDRRGGGARAAAEAALARVAGRPPGSSEVATPDAQRRQKPRGLPPISMPLPSIFPSLYITIDGPWIVTSKHLSGLSPYWKHMAPSSARHSPE